MFFLIKNVVFAIMVYTIIPMVPPKYVKINAAPHSSKLAPPTVTKMLTIWLPMHPPTA